MLSTIVVTSKHAVSDLESEVSLGSRNSLRKKIQQQQLQRQKNKQIMHLNPNEMLTDKFNSHLYKPHTLDFVSTFQPFALPQGKDMRKEGWLKMMNHPASVNVSANNASKNDSVGQEASAATATTTNTTKQNITMIQPSQTANLSQLETFISETIKTKFYGGDEEDDEDEMNEGGHFHLFHLYRPCFAYAYRTAKFLKRRRKKIEEATLKKKMKNKKKLNYQRMSMGRGPMSMSMPSKSLATSRRATGTGRNRDVKPNSNSNSNLNSGEDEDHIGFSDFRIFVVYICVYAHMLDVFIGQKKNNKNKNKNKNNTQKGIDDNDVDVSMCLDQFLSRYNSFSDPGYGWKIFNNVDSRGMAVVLFDDIDMDDSGYVFFSQWVKRVKQEEMKHKTPLGALLSGKFAFDTSANTQSNGDGMDMGLGYEQYQRIPLGDLEPLLSQPSISSGRNRSVRSKRSLSTRNINKFPNTGTATRTPKEISVISPPRHHSVDGDAKAFMNIHTGLRSSNRKRKPTKSKPGSTMSSTRSKGKLRSTQSKSDIMDGSTIASMPISINASPLSPGKFKVIMPVKIANAYKPPKDASPNLKDFFRSFQPYAEKLATSRSLRKNGFAAHGDGSGFWTLVDVESFVYSTLEEDASDVGWLFMKYKSSFHAAFTNAVQLNKMAREQEIIYDNHDSDNNADMNFTDDGSDHISFREFRMLNAFLCVYASMLETFTNIRDHGQALKSHKQQNGHNHSGGGSIMNLNHDDHDRLYLTKSEWIDGRENIGEAESTFVALKNASDIYTARVVFKKMDIHELNRVSFLEFCKYVKETEIHAKTPLGKMFAGTLSTNP